jgi:aerobic carbon-monoxide dehydrogenase small subunit
MSLRCDVNFTINGAPARVSVPVDMSALTMIRDLLGLTGTKYGCGEGECGACTSIVDGVSVNACLMFAVDCDGRSVTTIEGLARDARAQALQEAFVAHGAVQCGFCTPGMMVQATHLLATHAQPDAAAVQRAIEGNLCRCTGYQKIVEAIVDAGAEVGGAS